MFALIVKEEPYSCGNVYGVFETHERASKAVSEIRAQNPNLLLDLEIHHFKLNTVYPGSFNGCGDCLTSWTYSKDVKRAKSTNAIGAEGDVEDAIGGGMEGGGGEPAVEYEYLASAQDAAIRASADRTAASIFALLSVPVGDHPRGDDDGEPVRIVVEPPAAQ